MMQIALHGRTETGPVREANEDLILVGRALLGYGGTSLRVAEGDAAMTRDGLLAIVADGMGGHAAGATAARMALETIDAVFYGVPKNGDLHTVVNAVREAAARANQAVTEAGASRFECMGMGCTLAGVALMGREYVVFHAGDSRVYRFRRGALRQLTEDDTLVALAVRSGRMTQAEAETSTARHYVTNATGVESFELHVAEPQSLKPGDTLVISSDGLHGMAEFEAMERILAQGGGVEERGAALAAEAVRGGGQDNISVILIDAEEPEETAAHG